MSSNDNDQVLIQDVHQDGIKQIVGFCQGEMSAVETYAMAIQAARQGWLITQLRKNLVCHQKRATLLRQRILQLGGAPPASSGAWGTFANVVESVASAISESAALSILEEGERHGVTMYQQNLAALDEDSRRLVTDKMIPLQWETRNALAVLRRAIAA